MFMAFKLCFVVDSLAFFGFTLFGLLFDKLGNFFSNLLVTLTGDKQQFASGVSEGRIMD
jgi:hypothetical protein